MEERTRKIDLLKKGNGYKACLHTHTTVSDGCLTPEETKRIYKEHGYSVVAFSDHQFLVPHNDLSDENFIALTATEMSINEHTVERCFPYEKTYHLNCFSKDKNKDVSPVYCKKPKWEEKAKQYTSEEQRKINYPIRFDQETVQDVLDRLNNDGFLVSLNHPEWSRLDEADYVNLDGLWGVEVFNSICAYKDGLPDTVKPFENLLSRGKNVFPLATDDMHFPQYAFGGFVVLKMPSLTYENVITAMENGDFYASQGPEIYAVSLEGTLLKISCSPAESIRVNTQMRIKKQKRGSEITEAEFDLKDVFDLYEEAKKETGKETYFRITITDKEGKNAYTRAFFLKDLI